MRPFRPLILLPILAALAGCFGSAPPVPKEQYFRLIADAPTEAASKKIKGGIEIVPFAGEGVMSERPLLFTADGGRKLEQRNYAYWTDAPPQMLRDQLSAPGRDRRPRGAERAAPRQRVRRARHNQAAGAAGR